ncbi:MAG: YraN family protein [Spirochaetales bacterium]|nr:MAG: YraN family protein [Spirochaetales bacterium]
MAENTAAAWLESSGWRLVARNWRKGPGEIDIVATRGGELAFVEVKRVDAFGVEALSASVGPVKRRRIVETAKLFLVYHREFELMAPRFDVIAIRGDAIIRYLERAFSEHT